MPVELKHPFAKLCAEKGMSQRALAEATGIPEGSIWRVAAGSLAANHPMLPKVAEALGVPLATIQRMQNGPHLREARVANAEAKLGGKPSPKKPTPVSNSGRTPHKYDADSFGAFLQQHGFEQAATSVPDEFFSLARRLHERPEKVAANSPMLSPFAKAIGVSLSEVQAFAKAPPMEERWLKKITSQMERGTVPKGKKHSRAMLAARGKSPTPEKNGNTPPEKGERRRGKYRPRTPFAVYIWNAHSLTTKEMGEKIGIHYPLAMKVAMGLVAPNHPVVRMVAEGLHVSPKKIQSFMRMDPMPAHVLSRIAKQFDNSEGPAKKPGKAVVLHAQHVAPVVHRSANGNGNGNGNGHHVVAKGPYNRLKKQEVALRQAARDMVTTLNLAVMEGKEYAPPIRTLELHAVLTDYLTEKGLRANVLVDPNFAEFFDPK